MRPGPGALKRRLHEILRVDHAGELGAVWIYRGQKAVFDAAPGKQKITDDLAEMEGHEQVHLSRFDSLLNEHKVRPTLMAPLWRSPGFRYGLLVRSHAHTAECIRKFHLARQHRQSGNARIVHFHHPIGPVYTSGTGRGLHLQLVQDQ